MAVSKEASTEIVEVETDLLILGAGATGCGAAIAAKEKGVRVLLLDKQKLESSGCLGGGNDHFMAILNSEAENDTGDALVNFFSKPLSGYTPSMIQNGWVNNMSRIIDLLLEIGVDFTKNEDGSWVRTPGFGQPGDWWININNGQTIKRRLAKKIRSLGVDIMDHIMVTKLLKNGDQICGCTGYNVLDGSFYIFKAKKIVFALGNVANRAWTNSTGNPFNTWYPPYNTGSQFVLAYDTGVKLVNIDIDQIATLIPKGYGAPGMNGINSMGGHELNALGERFMGKYDPMWENGLRINQIAGTYQEQIEGTGPPFYMDMTHLGKEEVHHLQYVLMPGDKATYTDYCEQRGIYFDRAPLEVEISELAGSGLLLTNENFETNVSGLFNGCLFFSLSGAMCGGYYAGSQAAAAAIKGGHIADYDDESVLKEKNRIFRPLKRENGIHYQDFEDTIRQVMNYYMGYRRNGKGMLLALDKLNYIADYLENIKASNYHELMRANESAELLKMCQLITKASIQRKESGRAYYRRTDYPDLDPDLGKSLVFWQENGDEKFSWGV